MSMANDAPLLDLATLVDPVHVRIDGALYELHRPDRLSIAQLAEVERLRPQIAQLEQFRGGTVGTLSDEDLATAAVAIARVCEIVLAAPADVQARLSDVQRVAILQAFTELSSRPARRAAGATRRTAGARSTTGATSPRGSRASTAALRRTG
jgi:hypothetical protein